MEGLKKAEGGTMSMMDTLDFCCAGDGYGSLAFDEQKDQFQCRICGKTYEFSKDGFTYYKIHSIREMAYVLISARADIMQIHSVESYYIFNDNDKEFVYARVKRFSFGALRLWALTRRIRGTFLIEKRNGSFAKG